MKLRIVSGFLLCVLAAVVCAAQSNLASISGIITDPQGAVVPEATITALNVATGIEAGARWRSSTAATRRTRASATL